jgi:ribosomal protein L7/L12
MSKMIDTLIAKIETLIIQGVRDQDEIKRLNRTIDNLIADNARVAAATDDLAHYKAAYEKLLVEIRDLRVEIRDLRDQIWRAEVKARPLPESQEAWAQEAIRGEIAAPSSEYGFNKISLIKLARQQYGYGLREAKDLIETTMARMGLDASGKPI